MVKIGERRQKEECGMLRSGADPALGEESIRFVFAPKDHCTTNRASKSKHFFSAGYCQAKTAQLDLQELICISV
jgi:hypothetical protein